MFRLIGDRLPDDDVALIVVRRVATGERARRLRPA
jgi:hypothetical protein